MASGGWIKLWRQTLYSEVWEDQTAFRVFITLLLLADPNGVVKIGKTKLAGHARTAITTCYEATRRLVANGMLNATPNGKKTIYEVCNWSEYQSANRTIDRTIDRTVAERSPNGGTEAKKERNKEVKNNNILPAPIVAGDINNAMKLFGSLNPNYDQLFKRKNQREAVKRLLDKHGYDNLTKFVEYAASVNGQDFAPVITTPCQMEDKFGTLKAFYERNNKKGVKVWKVR